MNVDGPSSTSTLRKKKPNNLPQIRKQCLSEDQVSKLFDEPLSSDDDLDCSSDTDLGEGDSADEEDVNDIRQVSSPIIQNENEISIPSPDIEPSLPTTRQIVRRAPRISRNNYTWVDDKPSINKINFNENSGLKVQPEGDQPIDFFNLLLTSDFYSLVVKETNNYAADLYMNRSSDKSRISNWVDVDIDELKIFFGLLFHTGTIKMSRIEDYWKTSKLFNLNIFRASMSRNRYMLIMRALHFCTNPESESDIQNISRIYKIEPVLNYFNNRMKEIYQPSKNLSLDESMVLWRGRLLFRQYIKNKRHKYGVKLYMLTEPIGLVQKILIYTGQGTNVSSDMTHTECVVEQLMEDHLYKGHSLFMDNYYNSVNLAHKLLEKKTYCTGTLRSNRTNNPKSVIEKKIKVGESICKYTSDGVCVAKWKDRREVITISSKFKGEMVEATNRRGTVKMKPETVVQYNRFMSGIDRQDQMMAYYPCERKTLRWYKKIGIHFLQICMLNSHLLYNKNIKKMSYYDFRLSVINSLLSVKSNTTTTVPKISKSDTHFPNKVEKNEKNRFIRKRCKFCATKGIRAETLYFCSKCEDKPGLCIEPCFERYHQSD